MKDLLAVIAKGLVDDPDSVSVKQTLPTKREQLFTTFMLQKTTWAESSVSRAELPRLSAQLPAVPLSAVKKKSWLKSTD